MAPATDFPKTEDDALKLRWSARVSLTSRILAVNIFALAMLAGGFFYLDSYRSRLIDSRLHAAVREAAFMAEALSAASPAARPALILRLADRSGARLRTYGADGALELDSWRLGPPNYILRDPDEEAWQRHVARFMDRTIDFVVGADQPPSFHEPARDTADAWPLLREARQQQRIAAGLARAPDSTPMVTAASPLAGGGGLVVTANERAITRTVRAERFRLGVVLALIILVSVLLSLFLARTIVRPLRRLARAAVRVRLGRAREVVVPRLPSRRDEIGLLARAVSDMSQALRQRIDATEAFAADVTHELKNPLASLRSAADTLASVRDPAAQAQMLSIVQDDIRRLDRLITDIAEAARADAQLSRAKFEPIDLGQHLEKLIRNWEARQPDSGVRVAFARPRIGVAVVMGEPSRLVRVFENLLDNAVSFSPPGGVVRVLATQVDGDVVVRVEDEGPGVPVAQRDEIFRRFHSLRPEGESFGRHSGLGLAIARTIVEAHDGTISAEDRADGMAGASFVIRLPAVGAPQP